MDLLWPQAAGWGSPHRLMGVGIVEFVHAPELSATVLPPCALAPAAAVTPPHARNAHHPPFLPPLRAASAASDKAATAFGAEFALLREEAHRAMGIKERDEREAVDILKLFCEVENTFAETQAQAERAVEARREEQRRVGCGPDVDARWSVEDVGKAYETRVDFLRVLYDRLEVPGINLDLLATIRAALQADLVRRKEAIGFRAHELSIYMALQTYYPELGEDGVPLLEDDYGVPIVAGEEEVGSNMEVPKKNAGDAEAAAMGVAESSAQGTRPPAGDGKVSPTGGIDVPPTGGGDMPPTGDMEVAPGQGSDVPPTGEVDLSPTGVLPRDRSAGGRFSRLFLSFNLPPAADIRPKLPSGSWEGSVITEGHIEYLRRTWKLPSEEIVEARAPRGERAPEPDEGERVDFGSHLLVGFGLLASSIHRHVLDFYGLQMHHLGVNSVLYITCFVTLCEAYLGFHPFLSFFCHVFNFRA
ncbi:hypothetical protein D1007_10315 [Hordeum vulgare]|nr:hypothetical protein D1007_10315 [Hordeum vulgare]